MFAFLRNHIVWVVIVVIVALGGGGLFMSNQANAKKAEAAKVAAAKAPKSPYVAIANGKALLRKSVISETLSALGCQMA